MPSSNVIEFSIRGIDKFSGTMKKVATSLASLAKKVLNVVKWATVAAAALVTFVSVIASGIDTTAKFSNRIGVAVEELSKMQFVASQAGISTEQFNMATQRMTRRVAEAAEGVGEATGALRELGINAKSFRQLGLEDQMSVLAERISQVKNPADQLRLAFKLFDSEGTSMLQMLKQGSPAMQQMAADAEFLGLVISKQAAANAEHFSDSMGRASGSLKGASRAIAGELMPVMSGLANQFADFVATNRGNIVNFVRNAVVAFFTFIEVLKQLYATFKGIFSGNFDVLSTFLRGIGEFVVKVSVAFVAMGHAIVRAWVEAFKASRQTVLDFGGWLGGALKAIVTGEEVADFTDYMAERLVENFAKAGAAIRSQVQEDMGVVKLAFDDAGEALLTGYGVNLDQAREKAQAAIASISEFGTVATSQLIETAEATNEFMEEFRQRQDEFVMGLQDNVKTFVDSFFDMVESTVDAIGQGFANVVMEGASMAEVFKGLAKSVLSTLIASLVKMGLQRLMLSAMTKTAVSTEAAADMAKASAATYGNSFASIAAIPIIGPAMAPGVAAAATAAMQAGATASAAAGSSLGASLTGMAHDGMTRVPKEGTYLLDKGERVLSPQQNSDLESFMGGGGGGMSIGQIIVHVFENATNADALLSMDQQTINELVAGPIIKAFNSLDKKGIRPVFAERSGK